MNESNKQGLDKVVELLLSPDIANVQLAWAMINGKIWEDMYELHYDGPYEGTIDDSLSKKEALGYIYAKFFLSLVTTNISYGASQGAKLQVYTGVWYVYVTNVSKAGKTTHMKGRKQSQIYQANICVRYAQVNWLRNYALLKFTVYIWHDGKNHTAHLTATDAPNLDETTYVRSGTTTSIMGLNREVIYKGYNAVERLSKLFGSWTP